MKCTPFLFALAIVISMPCCEKTSTESSGTMNGSRDSADNYAELMELPEAEKMMGVWVNNPDLLDHLEVEPPRILVEKVSDELFKLRVQYVYTASTDIYAKDSRYVPGRGQSSVTELVNRKGDRKVRYFTCDVRHGPMGWGRTPDLVKWNWEKPIESGDDVDIYKGRVVTAENYGINSEGTASSISEVLIRGTEDYLKAVAEYPEVAKTEAEIKMETDREFEEEKAKLNDKKKLDDKLRQHFENFYGK